MLNPNEDRLLCDVFVTFLEGELKHHQHTTKKGAEGTGLGLSITNDILTAHGFSLKIASEPGKTVFEIGIPV